MDHFTALKIFVAVADAKSFTRAAERLGLSRAVVSKYVQGLEKKVNARLLDRTTRRVALTESGALYVARCRRILDDLSEADRLVRRQHAEPRGALKVMAPVNFGAARLGRAVAAFLSKFRDMRIELTLSDRFFDPIESGHDIAIRIGRPRDSSLIAKRINRSARVLCATPAYLAARGAPTCPRDLQNHDCLSYSHKDKPEEWPLQGPGGVESVSVTGPLVTSNGEALRGAMLADLGIVHGPKYFFSADLGAGRAVRVLPDYTPPTADIFAVYGSNRDLSAKVRAFTGFMAAYFRDHPA